MFTLDKHEFEKRGATGCSDSAYRMAVLTCCDRQVVEDVELSELYFDATDLSRRVSLLRNPDEAPRPCPLCRATDWKLTPIDDVANASEEWRWAYPAV
jgi:hypothetical protein